MAESSISGLNSLANWKYQPEGSVFGRFTDQSPFRRTSFEISQSAATALREFFGTDRLDFSLATPSLPGVVRSFQSFSQAADEASVSRIYAGQHFRYDEDAGQTLGDQVGDFVADHILEPVRAAR